MNPHPSPLPEGEGASLGALRCPDCGAPLEAERAEQLVCSGCRREYEHSGRFLQLLPSNMAPESLAEDSVFAPDGRELSRAEGAFWRFVVARIDIYRFADEILPELKPGPFLELGGETSYAAALFKAKHPGETVYASDVAPNTMKHFAPKTAALFGALPDYFTALDAEHLPFADGSLQNIFGQSMLHHLPHPERALRECQRVLRPGGTAIFVDHCVPRHWRRLFASVAHARSGEYGIREDLHTLRDWQRIVDAAGLPRSCLGFFRSPRYILNPWFVLGGRVLEKLPLALVLPWFPVGLVLTIEKATNLTGG